MSETLFLITDRGEKVPIDLNRFHRWSDILKSNLLWCRKSGERVQIGKFYEPFGVVNHILMLNPVLFRRSEMPSRNVETAIQRVPLTREARNNAEAQSHLPGFATCGM
jgi:hypothetical protein